MEVKKVRVFEFDGTRKSFDLMMLRMFPFTRWCYFVDWVDEKGNTSSLFTGLIRIRKGNSNILYKKGCWYYIDVREM